ncbi:uncharacterized protein LOC124655732 [Lolium rigidum]|uniref:uncharacterized protein LOC124655732 n=1 Tax=Lolium rigidum TaxID=89674 RepID=UPI001F5C61CE|nr:uncharacterized protein LOC124655732 [Lolium rigidum]
MAMSATSSALLGVLLFSAVVYCSGAGDSPLDQLCGNLGGYYVTPELCTSALCGADPSACRNARSKPELAALATRLAAANATATKASIESALGHGAGRDAEATKGLRSCLQLYAGAVPALQWATQAVAAGRYRGAGEVLQAAVYIGSGCTGMAGQATLPRENDRFSSMAIVAHAVVAFMTGY